MMLAHRSAEEDAMESESRQAHWEKVYTSKGENEVSWFQESPAPSLALIAEVGAAPVRRSSTSAAVHHGWSITSSISDFVTSPCSIYPRRHWRPPKPVSANALARAHLACGRRHHMEAVAGV